MMFKTLKNTYDRYKGDNSIINTILYMAFCYTKKMKYMLC